MNFILGQKKSMTQIFKSDGEVVPVTMVTAGPCFVTQVKNQEHDGYTAVQLGYGSKNKLNKPLSGHLAGLANFQYLKEFCLDTKTAGQTATLKRGDQITLETFKEGELVDVIGFSKGKGFQGVVKRHHFHGHPETHGHKDQVKRSGSIGAGGVQHVFKGKRMAGHMGDEQVTTKNLEIVKIDLENNLLYIKGAVPGARGSLVLLEGMGELKISEKVNAIEPQENKVEVAVMPEIQEVQEVKSDVEKTPEMEVTTTEQQ